jgi:hypothetical protein
MTARIYKPAKTAMQSGKANARQWVLTFDQAGIKRPDPLMGWAGSADTQTQVLLRFSSLEAAIAYAKKKELDYYVEPEQNRTLKLQNYADNFR